MSLSGRNGGDISSKDLIFQFHWLKTNSLRKGESVKKMRITVLPIHYKMLSPSQENICL